MFENGFSGKGESETYSATARAGLGARGDGRTALGAGGVVEVDGLHFDEVMDLVGFERVVCVTVLISNGGCKLRGRDEGSLYDHWGDGHSSACGLGFCQVTLRMQAATAHCWNVFVFLCVFFFGSFVRFDGCFRGFL